MDHLEILQVLESCELFKGLEKSNIDQIADLCGEKTYKAGEYVFRQGDFGEYLYIIAEGHIFQERSMVLGTKKGNVAIGVLGKGRVLGCWSTLLSEPHNHLSSAACQKPTKVVAIQGSNLREMMLNNMEFGFKVLENICLSLRNRIQGAYGAMEKI